MLRAFALAVLCAPASALACFVCGQVSEQGQGAYLSMTFVMSALPLIAMGAIGFWVVRRVIKHDRELAAEHLVPTRAPSVTERRDG